MNKHIIDLLWIILIIICVIVSGFCLYNGVQGWGWFLLVALIFGLMIK